MSGYRRGSAGAAGAAHRHEGPPPQIGTGRLLTTGHDCLMGKRHEKGKVFADVVAQVKATPTSSPATPRGKHGDVWTDPTGRRFARVTDELTPTAAQELAKNGASVVYDPCGCGGTECRLDWLSAIEVADLSVGDPPVLHPTKNGRADLEHWRSTDNHDLVVTAVEVSWGSRIPR
jgi:hypothetical protein